MHGNEELATWPSQSRIREINADALLPFPFYSAQNPVPFPAADRSHLRKSWFISAQDSRPPFIIVGKSWQQELKDVVTSQTRPEACPLGESGSCQADNHSSHHHRLHEWICRVLWGRGDSRSVSHSSVL